MKTTEEGARKYLKRIARGRKKIFRKSVGGCEKISKKKLRRGIGIF